jgi:NAD(P)-dependent dehydrogenase (short-subunit alcohol dehydrogenase family)
MLGEKHAETIAEFGGTPILLDVDKKIGLEKAQRISDKYQVDCKYQFCDITDESQILNVRDSLLSKFGQIDILINNAAIDPKVKKQSGKNLSRLENFPLNQWNLELGVGLTGAMICSKIFGYEMAKKGTGVILNISSDLGVIGPDQRLYKKEEFNENEQPVKPVTYSVIKHGLIGLTKYLATYWADKGVRCNALCPGGIYNNQPDEFIKKISKLIPMGRMANSDEYKAAVVFLVSKASSYMNGAVVTMDGGRSTW